MSANTIGTDVIVIGAGPVGENVADRVVRGGLTAVLIESELAGGECSYWACMPSKALIRPGTALHAARSVAGARAAASEKLDVAAVLARRDRFAAQWHDDGQVRWIESAGISFLRGAATITGEREVTVEASGEPGPSSRDPSGAVSPDVSQPGSVTVTATTAVVLATGSSPVIPSIPGLETVPYWGTREATSAQHIPERLAVIGGGVAGTELAQIYARLGSRVTMLVRGRLLSGFPSPAVDLVADALIADGIDLRLETVPRAISSGTDGIDIVLDDGTATVDRLLISTGRRPNLEGLGLRAWTPADTSSRIRRLDVDETGRVDGVDGGWLYAVGDAAGKALLTHQGKYEARLTGDAIAARANGTLDGPAPAWSRYAATADDVAVPQVVFTDPEIAMVGHTVDEARAAGLNAVAVRLDLAVAGSALHADGYRGWAQMVVDEDRQILLGMTFAGPDVAELLHAASIAIVAEVPLERLRHAVPAYPTMSEIWLRLLEAYGL